jgi:hypothetical protein
MTALRMAMIMAIVAAVVVAAPAAAGPEDPPVTAVFPDNGATVALSERQVFPLVEARLSPEALAELGRALTSADATN